jgi:hypothetical protein
MYLGQLVESASRDALFSRSIPTPAPAGRGADPRPHSEPQALVQGEIRIRPIRRRLPLFIAARRPATPQRSCAARGGPGPSGGLPLGRVLSAADGVIYF